MIDRGKRTILGVGVDVVDYDGAVERILKAARARRAHAVSALAVHGVMTGALDPEQKYRLNRLDTVTPDGHPVRWALRWLHGERLPDRVYGPRLTEEICKRAADEQIAIYLYGSRTEVIDTLCEKLPARFPGLVIAGAEPSKFRALTNDEETALRARITGSGAGIVLVGLGCPRQEVFVYEHSQDVQLPMLAVGAAFDFFAGTLRQAPKWMQDRGLEWLFRLAIEPRRLWRRYVYLNPLYLALVACQRVGIGKDAMDRTLPPRDARRYG